MKKQTVTFSIDSELFKKFKIKCIKEGKSYSEVIEQLMQKKISER